MKALINTFKALYNDEQGASMVEKILIIAAIVLPLLGLLIYFRDYITEWVGGDVQDVRTDSDNYDPNQF